MKCIVPAAIFQALHFFRFREISLLIMWSRFSLFTLNHIYVSDRYPSFSFCFSFLHAFDLLKTWGSVSCLQQLLSFSADFVEVSIEQIKGILFVWWQPSGKGEDGASARKETKIFRANIFTRRQKCLCVNKYMKIPSDMFHIWRHNMFVYALKEMSIHIFYANKAMTSECENANSDWRVWENKKSIIICNNHLLIAWLWKAQPMN